MLTRSGLGAAVAAVVALVLGWWWGYEELVLVGVCVLVLVLVAIWVAQRPLRSTIIRRVETIRVARGDPIRLTYRVRNDTRHRAGRATILDRCDRSTTEVTVDPIPPDAVVDLRSTIDTTRRGVFPLGPLDVERLDPFLLALGRWRDDRDEAAPVAITVHPRVYDLTGPQGSMRVVENESVLRRAATDPLSGFVSMREYVPGDDPRLIHWPTTARVGNLMVREHVEVRRPEFTVVVDTGPDVGTDADFEEQVDVAATVAVHSLRTGLDVVVRTTDRGHAGRPVPLVDEGDVLDLLTPVQRSTADSLIRVTELFRHGFDHTSIVMVTGPEGPSSRVASSEQMVVVRVGEGARLATGVAVAAIDAPDFVQRWKAWT